MKEMKKLLEANSSGGRTRISQVFRDFCELMALSMRNAVDHDGYDTREARYLEIVGNYSPEEITRFARVMALLVLEFENGLSDVLGQLYMSLDLGNERLGQFFTPFSVSLVMAKMTIGTIVDRLAGKEFVTVQEPASGSGGMIIAVADTLREAGVNYQRRIHVTATDLDITAVHMTYIQLTLLHVPAVVIHGNTLTQELFDVWPTPAHVIDGWASRLAAPAEPDDQGLTTAHAPREDDADGRCICDGPWPCPHADDTNIAA